MRLDLDNVKAINHPNLFTTVVKYWMGFFSCNVNLKWQIIICSTYFICPCENDGPYPTVFLMDIFQSKESVFIK